MSLTGIDQADSPAPRPRQRTVRIDFAPSLYDRLEELALERDESVNGVIYEAVCTHVKRQSGSGPVSADGFLSEE